MEKGEPFVGDDDGSGWIWAVAGLTVENGLTLELRKSTPLGMRALLVAKQDKVAEMFDTLNWKVVRLDTGPVQRNLFLSKWFCFGHHLNSVQGYGLQNQTPKVTNLLCISVGLYAPSNIYQDFGLGSSVPRVNSPLFFFEKDWSIQ